MKQSKNHFQTYIGGGNRRFREKRKIPKTLIILIRKRTLQWFYKNQDNYIWLHVFVHLQAESMSLLVFEDKSGPTIECLKCKQHILSIIMGFGEFVSFIHTQTMKVFHHVLNCWFFTKYNLMCQIDKCFRHTLIKKLISMGTIFHGFHSFWDLLQTEKILPI